MPSIYKYYSGHITFQCGSLETHTPHTQDGKSRAWSEWHDNRWLNGYRIDSDTILEFWIGSNPSLQNRLIIWRMPTTYENYSSRITIHRGSQKTCWLLHSAAIIKSRKRGLLKVKKPFLSLLRQKTSRK